MIAKSDWELICACRSGDRNAWGLLIDRYERLIYFVARQQSAVGEDSADIVQMTLTTLLENLHIFHPESNVKGWLCTVAKRHAWRYLNRYDRERPNVECDIAETPLITDQTVENDSAFETAQWLQMGINQLDPRCQQLLLTLYLQNETPTYEAVAAQLQMRVGSIGPTRARCLERLRRALETT